MSRRVVPSAVVFLLFWAGLAPGQQREALALIPADAAAALAVRHPDRLRIKGEKFVADAQLQDVLQVAQLFERLEDFLGGKGGGDPKGSGAILLARPEKKEDWGRWGIPNSRLLVGVVPVGNRAQLAQ